MFIKKYLESRNIKTRSLYWGDGEWVFKISNESIPSFTKLIKPYHSDKSKRLILLRNFFL